MPKDTFFNLPREKQERVIRSAIAEFNRHGYEKGHLGRLAQRAGIAKGSLYQYFNNKQELFLYSVRWAIEYTIENYESYVTGEDGTVSFFDYIYQNARELWLQLRKERDLMVFIQDVFLGRYGTVADESIKIMMKASEDMTLKLIRNGQRNGYIRKDIDDQMLLVFMSGATLKLKEQLIREARNAGGDLIDADYEVYEGKVKDLLELLKTGMGAR